jgi:hypothetical protein
MGSDHEVHAAGTGSMQDERAPQNPDSGKSQSTEHGSKTSTMASNSMVSPCGVRWFLTGENEYGSLGSWGRKITCVLLSTMVHDCETCTQKR